MLTTFLHTLYFGIFKRVVKWMLRHMASGHRKRFWIRVRDFPWTKTPPTSKTTKKKSKMSMTDWKEFACAAQSCLDGLVEDSSVKFFVKLVRWGAFVSQPMTRAEVQQAQADARGIVAAGQRIMGSFWNVPNVNGPLRTHTHVTHTHPCTSIIPLYVSPCYSCSLSLHVSLCL